MQHSDQSPAKKNDESRANRARALSIDEAELYSRHILLPEIGSSGQRALISAKIAIVGVGGIGAPAALYLSRAGVGTLGLIDADTVEISNLHRQILYHAGDIGQPKAKLAAAALAKSNPHISVNAHAERLGAPNAAKLLREYDLVLDGTDNFETRYLVNDTCFALKKPLVSAAVVGFEGQLATFVAGSGCYRCIFPEPPPGTAQNCSEAGVMGAMAGIMGNLAALEAIKLVTGAGDLLTGKLLLMHGLTMEFQTIRSTKNRACALCGAG